MGKICRTCMCFFAGFCHRFQTKTPANDSCLSHSDVTDTPPEVMSPKNRERFK